MLQLRNDQWKYDMDLEQCLKSYVETGLHRKEILDFVEDRFVQYAWSLRSLDRRLNYFGIQYTDYSIDYERVKEAVENELSGPGKLLGYRAMHQKIREIHHLNVPRDLVYAAMGAIDDSGLKERGGVGKPKRPRREKNFFSEGSDFTMSLDGHDKLCGFQKSTFPLCVYGGQDTFSGRIQFLRISTTNNDPKVIGRYYMDYLFETERLPLRLRVDRGTETGDLTTIHCYLLDKKLDDTDVTDCILYGPSTENKIERFWRELHHRLEIFFKRQLSSLLESGAYNPSNKIERQLLAYIYIPVIQKELNIFKECVWNNHRSRKNDKKELPTGVPEHIYHFPEKYGGRNCSFDISVNELDEVSELSGVYQQPTPYFTEEFKQKCLLHVDSNEINSADADTAYKYLKEHFE